MIHLNLAHSQAGVRTKLKEEINKNHTSEKQTIVGAATSTRNPMELDQKTRKVTFRKSENHLFIQYGVVIQ